MPVQVNQHILGNSLFNHSGGPLTNVPHWMDVFAEAAGHGYAVSGDSGFLRQFADAEMPGANWGFAGVDVAWDPEAETFADADLDVITVVPANFIQDQPPEADYHGDTRSPLEAMLGITGDISTAHPTAQIMVYQGWADLGLFTENLAQADTVMAEYHDYNQGDYLDWHVSLVDQINAADPDADVVLMPVAAILSGLLEDGGVLEDLAVDDLYTDTAPHGTETLYFLAAAINYTALYGEPVPAGVAPPEIDPRVIARLDEVSEVIASDLEAAGFDIAGTTDPALPPAAETGPDTDAATDPDPAEDGPEPPAPPPPPEPEVDDSDAGPGEAIPNPDLSFGLDDPEALPAAPTPASERDGRIFRPHEESDIDARDALLALMYGPRPEAADPALPGGRPPMDAPGGEDPVTLAFLATMTAPPPEDDEGRDPDTDHYAMPCDLMV